MTSRIVVVIYEKKGNNSTPKNGEVDFLSEIQERNRTNLKVVLIIT